MSERETIADDLRVLFAHNLKRAAAAYGIPEEHVGSFAAVLTMADYLNAEMPLVMKTGCLDASAREMAGGRQGEMKHPIEALNCTRVLKGCLREASVENLEDIQAYELCKGPIIDYIALWVCGKRRPVSAMSDDQLEELKSIYRHVLGGDLSKHE